MSIVQSPARSAAATGPLSSSVSSVSDAVSMLAFSGASSRMTKYQTATPATARSTSTPSTTKGQRRRRLRSMCVFLPCVAPAVGPGATLLDLGRCHAHPYAFTRADGSRRVGQKLMALSSGYQPAARSTASRQRSRSSAPAGLDDRGRAPRWRRRRPSRPTCRRPGRRGSAAPSVVASSTGDTSTGRWVASASACTNVGLALMPPSTRRRVDRCSPLSASAASTRSAPRWATPSSTARTTCGAARCPG